MKLPFTSKKDTNHRGEDRHRKLILAHMRSTGGEFRNISIIDISSTGFRATTTRMPDVDEAIELKLANQQVLTGVVKWVRHGCFGVQLDHDFDPHILINEQ